MASGGQNTKNKLIGAAMMIDNGKIPSPQVMDEIVGRIDREFNLPWQRDGLPGWTYLI